MQGYIVRIVRVKDEDLIVNILTKNALKTTYRFYGARHSSVNLGYKIDFEIEQGVKSSIGRLYDLLHLGFTWIHDSYRLRIWHQFISLFYPHLSDIEQLDEFYFELLEEASLKWDLQNPKRVAIESYVKLLEYEGRLHKEQICFFCNLPIVGSVTVIRSFIPAHTHCTPKKCIAIEALDELYSRQSTFFLNDSEVDELYSVMLEGL